MWHWAQVLGSRAIRAEVVCRVWQAMQFPMVPSLFGFPTLWHCSHPLVIADPPSNCTKGCGGRRVPPGWYVSEKFT